MSQQNQDLKHLLGRIASLDDPCADLPWTGAWHAHYKTASHFNLRLIPGSTAEEPRNRCDTVMRVCQRIARSW